VLAPFAAAYAATDVERQNLWQAMGCVGIALALWLISQLYFNPGTDVTVVRHSLAYVPVFDRPPLIVHALYLLLTVTPLVASSRRVVAFFGWIVFAIFVYSLAANRPAWYSVWCLAAATFSFVLALGIQEQRNTDLDEASLQS
jgi:hypothetical protein